MITTVICTTLCIILIPSAIAMSTNRFTARLNNGGEYRRRELIEKIERAIGQMTEAQLEALAYDLFTKGYIEE